MKRDIFTDAVSPNWLAPAAFGSQMPVKHLQRESLSGPAFGQAVARPCGLRVPAALPWFSFRVALASTVEVDDARAFAESQASIEPMPFARFMPQVGSHAALHAYAAGAAQEVVASHGLRELIADPRLLPDAVQAKIANVVPGARVTAVLLTSITLPPETRKMFTDVERSKIEAEASLERARGEQASLRALANAARLVKDNPALANLRFMQVLEQAPGAKTIVLGSDAVLPLTGGTR